MKFLGYKKIKENLPELKKEVSKSDIKILYFFLCILTGSFLSWLSNHNGLDYLMSVPVGIGIMYAIGKMEGII